MAIHGVLHTAKEKWLEYFTNVLYRLQVSHFINH